MDIKSSLAIEDANWGSVNLIFSGAFVRVYNHSYYLLSQIMEHKLTATMRHIKRADNRFVVYGGFPLIQVENLYPEARKMAWGYQINGDFDLCGYEIWLAEARAEQANCEVA